MQRSAHSPPSLAYLFNGEGVDVIVFMIPCDLLIASSDTGSEVFFDLGLVYMIGCDQGAGQRICVPVRKVTVTGLMVTVKFFSTVRKIRGKKRKRSSTCPSLLRSRVPWYDVPGDSGLEGLKTSVMSSAHSVVPFTAGLKEKSPCVRVRSTVAANSGVKTTCTVPSGHCARGICRDKLAEALVNDGDGR